MEEIKPSASFHTFLEEYESAKKTLGETEETLKRITGRDPELFGPGGPNRNKWKPNNFGDPLNRKRGFVPFRNNRDGPSESTPLKEDSPDEEEPEGKKPALQSTVVATPKDVKSRRDTIQEQNVNSKVKARNRRMLGMILGTLQKFQHDAKKTEEKDQRRAVVEQKVEAAALEEKERLKKEKEDLFLTRREKLMQLRCLQKKMEIAELHEVWESNQLNYAHFIKTTAEPPIYYLPAKHNEKTPKLLEESKQKTLDLVKERREIMEKELEEVEENYKKDPFPVDKENMLPEENEQQSTEQENNEQQSTEQQSTTQETDTEQQEPITEAENIQKIKIEPIAESEDGTNDGTLPIPTDLQEFEPIYD